MSNGSTDAAPPMQRLFDRIWLLAGAAFLFFLVAYVGWGLLDVISIPVR